MLSGYILRQRLRVFRCGTNDGARRCKTRRHWRGKWRSDTAPMSPLRCVASRGHIAGNLLSVGFPFGRPFKDSAFAAPALPRRPGAVARKAPRLCFGGSYPIRWRCRRLHITHGHIAQQHLTGRRRRGHRLARIQHLQAALRLHRPDRESGHRSRPERPRGCG